MNQYDNNRHNGYRGARPVYRETVYDNFYDDRISDRQRFEEEQIRRRMRQRRRLQEKRRVKRNRTVALVLLIVIIALIAKGCSVAKRKKLEKANSATSETAESKAEVQQEGEPEEEPEEENGLKNGHKLTQVEGMTYVDNILVVNKTYSIPADYQPGVSAQAKTAFEEMSSAALNDGVYFEATVDFVSYDDQRSKYKESAVSVGVAETDWLIERPGYSEHQTGLAFDVNSNDPNFAESTQGKWLAAHCCDYGFIIRYPQGKETKTGYDYNPWHIRFVGVEAAKEMTIKGQCLEEYLGITSDYTKGENGLSQESYALMIGAQVSKPDASSQAAVQASTDISPDTQPDDPSPDTQTETWYDDNNYDYGYDQDYDYNQTYDYGYDTTYDYGYGDGWY